MGTQPTYACLICKERGSADFLFAVGDPLERHFRGNHSGIAKGDRAKFAEPFEVNIMSIKVEKDVERDEREDGEVREEEDEAEAPPKEMNIPSPPFLEVDGWEAVKLILDRKAVEEKQLRRKLEEKQDHINALEGNLLIVRASLEKRKSENVEFQNTINNLQVERDHYKKKEQETEQRLRNLEGERNFNKNKISGLEEALERANSRCKRKDERNEELQLENARLNKKLKTVAETVNSNE